MSKAEQYIKQATTERVRSRGLIRQVATEAARIQRTETTAIAVEANRCARVEALEAVRV